MVEGELKKVRKKLSRHFSISGKRRKQATLYNLSFGSGVSKTPEGKIIYFPFYETVIDESVLFSPR